MPATGYRSKHSSLESKWYCQSSQAEDRENKYITYPATAKDIASFRSVFLSEGSEKLL